MSNAAVTKQGEKASSFVMTCNLLSQYAKGKGRSLGDLGLGATLIKNDTYRPPTTMSLLPGVDVSGNDTKERLSDRNATKSMDLFPQRAGFGHQTPPAAGNREPEKSQLTIFYGGKVLVFDQFPGDKARDLMMLAGKGCGTAKNSGFAPPTAASASTAEPKNLSTNLRSNFLPAPSNPPATALACPTRPAQAIVSDLPIARKASLHRFLEKRKDRINAKAPYQVNQLKNSPAPAVTPKMEEIQPWLGLKPSLNSECSR